MPSAPESEASLVPVIDLAPLIEGTTEGKLRVAESIRNACQDIGFFVITNHGIATDTVDACWDATQRFFDLADDQKCQLCTDDEAKYPYGYSPVGGEVLSRGKELEVTDSPAKRKRSAAGDQKEMFSLGPCDPKAGMPPRRMPSTPGDFTPAIERYYEAMVVLAGRLLEAFALALDLDKSWFEGKINRHLSALRLINYPTMAGVDVPAGAVRASAHTDYGTITILKSGGPGLQVAKDRDDPTWHDVPFVEHGFVVNLGDLMRRWTNDKWCSTLHRVVNPPRGLEEAWGRRQSVAFFHNLNADASVEVIPTCVTKDSPLLYDPINAKDFLMLKHLASMGKASADAHLKRRDTAAS